mmetsp:Transcript_70905/g.198848  ORF Transcript_70905/g.198848 Transcript_70905/m.198848 type:complete len:273 (+) Transcript_70905:128-946(+)
MSRIGVLSVFGFNDVVLFASLLYSCFDVLVEWPSFDACSRPIHKWLVPSYCAVVCFRVFHVAGARAVQQGLGPFEDDGVGEFLLDVRHKSAWSRALAAMLWAAMPAFAAWTLLGTAWLWSVAAETPRCMPSEAHLWFSGLWLALCYVWLAIHIALGVAALVLEHRVRAAEGDLRAIEDDEVRSRWGDVSRIAGYQALGAPCAGEGLAPSEILALPLGLAVEGAECSICLGDIRAGDALRRLGCGHAFHRPCIDLWLLRRADCPLCKRGVSTV